jgi:transposase
MLRKTYSDEHLELMVSFYENLTEKDQRYYVALEADKLGYGGAVYIAKVLNTSVKTVRRGLEELRGKKLLEGRVRKKGGGRKSLEKEQPKISTELDQIVESNKAGCPVEGTVWTNLTTQELTDELIKRGYKISGKSVTKLLKKKE